MLDDPNGPLYTYTRTVDEGIPELASSEIATVHEPFSFVSKLMLARVCSQPSSRKMKCASTKRLNGMVKLGGQRML